jgi:hypothetical protein
VFSTHRLQLHVACIWEVSQLKAGQCITWVKISTASAALLQAGQLWCIDVSLLATENRAYGSELLVALTHTTGALASRVHESLSTIALLPPTRTPCSHEQPSTDLDSALNLTCIKLHVGCAQRLSCHTIGKHSSITHVPPYHQTHQRSLLQGRSYTDVAHAHGSGCLLTRKSRLQLAGNLHTSAASIGQAAHSVKLANMITVSK